MKLSNLIGSSSSKSILSLSRIPLNSPTHPVSDIDTCYDLSRLIESGWLQASTELHVYQTDSVTVSGDSPNITMKNSLPHTHIYGTSDGAMVEDLRYLRVCGTAVPSNSLVVHYMPFTLDAIANKVLDTGLTIFSEDGKRSLGKYEARYAVRHSKIDVEVQSVREGNKIFSRELAFLEIPMRTKDIQTVRVYRDKESCEDVYCPPLLSFCEISKDSLTIKLDIPLNRFYVHILRGNTERTVLRGMKYINEEHIVIKA